MNAKLLNGYSYNANPIPTLPKFRACALTPPLSSAVSTRSLLFFSSTNSNCPSDSSSKFFCSRNDNAHQVSSQNFSVLTDDIPWDIEDIWSTMGLYMFTLHIPLGFGWISVASNILQQHDLDPQAMAISLLLAQSLELAATFIVLKFTAKGQFKFEDLFKANKLSKGRNWLLASAIGFGFLFALVVTTSFILDRVFEPKAFNNPIVKDMLLDSNITKAACVFVYCITAPLLEETVYRGFLLRSLSTTMKWQKAVLISSVVFSAAHLSGENFIQLVIIGCVLGCSYCWTGNLSSSIAIHSLYNAMTLIVTVLS